MEECDGKFSLGRLSIGGSRDAHMENSNNFNRNHRFQSMSALEILGETVRILRYNCGGFMAILAFLICPVSAIQLSNVLLDYVVRRLAVRLLLIARACGLPLSPFVKQSCKKFSEMVISTIMCFPFLCYIISFVESRCRVLCGLYLLEEIIRLLEVLCDSSEIVETGFRDLHLGLYVDCCGCYIVHYPTRCDLQCVFGIRVGLGFGCVSGYSCWSCVFDCVCKCDNC